jgi:hypothetical protein
MSAPMRRIAVGGPGAAVRDLAEIDAAQSSPHLRRLQRFDADGDRLPGTQSPVVGAPRRALPGWYALAARSVVGMIAPALYPADATDHARLPALIERARKRLAEAMTTAEVLEAKAVAEAALHYAKITKAANETQADCLRTIVRAEMRLADEIDRGQANGQVAKKNQTYVQGSDITATYEELGIDRRRVAECRETRDAGEAVVEKAINGALAENRPPKKADIRRAVEDAKRPFRVIGTGESEWFTPGPLIEMAREVLGGIDLDPASCDAAQRRVKAARYFTLTNDGLSQDWAGKVWLNPPYSQLAVALFAGKLVAECESGRVTDAIMLTHNYTDTAWFHHAERACEVICFTRGRVRFERFDGFSGSPTQGQALFYFGPNVGRFRKVFADMGFIR